MRLSVAVPVALALTSLAGAAPAATHGRARVTITEFQLDGGPAPALALQLQDGFVLGLVRSGVQVIDPTDTGHKLEGHPELQHCDSSPCLKAIGQLLDVGYLVRVKIDVAGNSYKGVARLFTTEGAAPAALPVATESKSCDVCTVAEARATMLKLADAVRSHIDEPAPPAPVAPPPAPPPAAPHLAGPVVLALAGVLAVAAGAAVLAGDGGCAGTSCSEGRARNAMGGVLIGAGAALTLTGGYVTVIRARGGDPGHRRGRRMALVITGQGETMTEQKRDTTPSSSARPARLASPAATLVAFLAVGSAGFLFAHGCGSVSNDRDAAINQATTATCQRYQACNAIGPGLSYATVGDCQADWKNKFTTQWTAQACQNRIDQTNLNICLDGISSTICTSLLDVLNTFYVKCSVNGVCDVPPDAAAKD